MDGDTTSPDEETHGAHSHRYDPVERSSGQRLDVRSDDPADLRLWDKLYKHCAVGTLVCAECDETSDERHLYLRMRNNKRQVCQYRPEQVAAVRGESAEHQALKDVICELAQDRGLAAEQEISGSGRQRVTDVVVSGGCRPVGWEVQLSPIEPDKLRRRIAAADRDGVAPSWLSMQSRSVWRTLIQRAPATTTRDMSHLEIRQTDNPIILGGIKRIKLDKCDAGHRSQRWHRDLKCTGWHGRPDALATEEHPRLGGLIELTADGRLVPYQWPRKTKRYGRFWLLAPAGDVARFNDAERPFLHQDDNAVVTDFDGPAKAADDIPWHVTKKKLDNAAASRVAITCEEVEALLGPRCPSCGWTQGRHRPAIKVGAVRMAPCPWTLTA